MCPGFLVFASLANLSENASMGIEETDPAHRFSMPEMAQKLD